MAGSAGLRLLEAAHELVSQGWSRGHDARDASGRPVDPWSDAACSWSILGAIVAVLEREAATSGELPLEELAAALYALADVVNVDSLEFWNDALARTQDDVLATLGRAAAVYRTAYPCATAS